MSSKNGKRPKLKPRYDRSGNRIPIDEFKKAARYGVDLRQSERWSADAAAVACYELAQRIGDPTTLDQFLAMPT